MGALAEAIEKRRRDENAGRIPYICTGCGLVNWPDAHGMRAVCIKCKHPRFPARVAYPQYR